MHLGEFLEKKIKEQGFSIEDVANELNLARSTVFRWVKSERMSKKHMKKVADVIGLDLRAHLEGFDGLYATEYTGEIERKYISALEEIKDLRQILHEYQAAYGNLPGTESGQKPKK